MTPGYYIVTRNTTLVGQTQRITIRLRLPKNTWLVTDGVSLGKFSPEELDWMPLEWVRGDAVIIDEYVEPMLTPNISKASFTKFLEKWNALLAAGPNDPVPDAPKPPLNNLGAYLKRRRLMAKSYSYDRR